MFVALLFYESRSVQPGSWRCHVLSLTRAFVSIAFISRLAVSETHIYFVHPYVTQGRALHNLPYDGAVPYPEPRLCELSAAPEATVPCPGPQAPH